MRLAATVKIFGCSRISGTARHDPRLPRGLGRWALRLGSASPFRSRLPGFAPSQRRTRLAPLLVLPLSDITVAGFTPILAAQLPHACSRLCHQQVQVHGPVGRTCHRGTLQVRLGLSARLPVSSLTTSAASGPEQPPELHAASAQDLWNEGRLSALRQVLHLPPSFSLISLHARALRLAC